jgi:hypothetical protein
VKQAEELLMWHVKYLVRFLGVLGLLLCWNSCSDIIVSSKPEVVWTDPENGATNVATTYTIRAGFSRVVDPSTVTTETFFINNGVEGTVSYTGTTAEFTPSRSLNYSTTYTATITTGVRDKEENALEAAYVWSFTTKRPPPTITGFSPDSGRPGTVVTITGVNFMSSPTSNSVSFNGISAKVVAATPTEIQAEVPTGATTGPITVATSGGQTSSPGEFQVIYAGRIWEVTDPGSGNSLTSVTWLGTRFVAVGAMGTILTSSDGLAWTPRMSGVTSGLNGLAWSGRQIVVVGTGGAVLTSPNGINWEVESSGTTKSLFAVAWSESLFVAAGADGCILTSPDGSSWRLRNSPTDHWLFGATSFGGLVTVCGHWGTILTSTNGALWRAPISGTEEHLLGITATQEQLVVVGYFGTILTSSDGNTWISRPIEAINHLGGVTRGVIPVGIRIVAVGAGGAILTSLNGIHWTARSSPTTVDLNDVAWSGSLFVAVGENGIIITSY